VDYQSKRGLVADGVAGPQTQAALNASVVYTPASSTTVKTQPVSATAPPPPTTGTVYPRGFYGPIQVGDTYAAGPPAFTDTKPTKTYTVDQAMLDQASQNIRKTVVNGKIVDMKPAPGHNPSYKAGKPLAA